MKKTLALALLGALLVAPLATARADDEASGIGTLSGDARVVHALNRLGYGPRPGDVSRVRQEGLFKHIVLQLHPERVADTACEERLEAFQYFRLTAAELETALPPLTKEQRMRLADLQKKAQELRKEKKREELRRVQEELNALRKKNDRNLPLMELMRAKIIRAVHSERQLEQVMVDFWFNHFNVFGRKGAAAFLIPELEEHVIRPRAFGKFEELLVAVAKSPAMLVYLDNWMSVAPEGSTTLKPSGRGLRRRRGRGSGLNENYARELLELHTLGVDNGYTQKDIIEVARCFTGWTVSGGRNGRVFEFRPERHDAGPKKVMGKRIRPGRGVKDGLDILTMLAHHPNTARYMSEKLCRRFVSDDPPADLVERCAATWLRTGGDIRLVLYRIFTSPEFFSEEAARAKVKKPHEYVVSALRAVDAETDAPRGLLYQIGQMGEPLYLCEPPTGYSDAAEKWGGTNAILSRVNFATALAFGRVPGAKPDYDRLLAGAPVEDPAVLIDWLVRAYLGQPLSPTSAQALDGVVEQARATARQQRRRKASTKEALGFLTAMILGSPDFQMQ
jgi:uncharacterized protein (DUF1800 family)